jgi:hypothetical protein
MEHQFTQEIENILDSYFSEAAEDIYEKSPLLQYLNIKTRSATRGSKARGSFANLYAIYILVEDYVNHGFDKEGNYPSYDGAIYSNLLKRQRELPFGSKLQNHALNHRMNLEFRKYFSQVEYIPILRNVDTHRYWINENLLKVSFAGQKYNIARAIIDIIDRYIEIKQSAFDSFIQTCERLKQVAQEKGTIAGKFILNLLEPNVDARIFEIVSYAILKYYYNEKVVYFGFSLDEIEEENLKLYKTGRTNANDGGIDFVMRPLGRFFQVTETLDVRKYFLDIDKIERYPISFVIKSEEPIETLRQKLKEGAEKQYSIKAVVRKYMNCVEEMINIPVLKDRFNQAVCEGHLKDILDEIVKQSRIEFNYE